MAYDDGDSKWHQLLLEEQVGTLEFLERPAYRHHLHHDDSTPHYIVYNADTRLASLYPDACVLEDADVLNPRAFAARLAGPPHFLHVPSDPNLVRQVFVRVSQPECLSVPHACSKSLAKLASGVRAGGGECRV